DEGPGPDVRGLRRQRDPEVPAPGSAGDPREHDLSRDHRRGGAAHARGVGPRGGAGFLPAFSPERIDPGNPNFGTRNIPKVVGGVTGRCTEVAQRLYEASVDTVVPVSSTQVAEMVKLLENTFRIVNIGLVNEIALMCSALKINVWEVIEAAKTKPFGFMAFYPGPGLGGHCIPIDPFYLSWKAKMNGFDARFIELAGHINESMPRFVVERITDALNQHRKSIRGS